MLDVKIFLERLNQLMDDGVKLINSSPPLADYNPLQKDIHNYADCHSWGLSCLNLLRNFFGEQHPFYREYKKAIDGGWFHMIEKGKQPIEYCKEDIVKSYAVLKFIKEEINLGLVTDAQHLYVADLFSNLLEQSKELLEKDYLVGAAVYCRLVVENFINDLCRIKNAPIEDNDKLPQKLIKLRKIEVIDLPLERMIQAIYDIGTYAVHGEREFEKYKKEDISDTIETIKKKILTIR